MKEVKDFFPMIEFETAQEALLQVFSFLLYEGKSKNYLGLKKSLSTY